MDVKSLDWTRKSHKYWYSKICTEKYLTHFGGYINKLRMYVFIHNIKDEYSKILNIQSDKFDSIFWEKNEVLVKRIEEFYGDDNYSVLRPKSKKMKAILSEITIPDVSLEELDELYNNFIKLSDLKKSLFLQRIEPIKSKLEI